MLAEIWLRNFVRESNKIEDIKCPPYDHEIAAHEKLLALPVVTVGALVEFVQSIAHAPLRDRPGMNVRVGSHYPPPGGPDVREALQKHLLTLPTRPNVYLAHKEYETLHPFMDGNGRSGRALWLWMMERQALGFTKLVPWRETGFLHWFYYQALNDGR